ncbi:YqaJ viral recombinase family protein [Leifsonia sp. NPDC056824]|uniref:YqaJ viral recombinase family protein n=1 Tax=Leifsonia sp. NPDC056824 TaxID=3345953 RepID=UPI0036B7B549
MTDILLPGALAELESRAGASDADRPAWLAERRLGISATEIRDLYLKKISFQKLIDQKLGRIPEGSDRRGKAAAWGHEREPEIAVEVLARYNMVPESRVIHAADDPRKLASPDGVGLNFDEQVQIAEIKTHGLTVNIEPGSKEFDAKGYFLQMVWQMRVLGARRCLYAIEQRLVAGSWYEPGAQQFFWVEWDEKAQQLAAELDALADRFLAALDAAAGEDWSPEPVDEELDTHAVNYLRALELEREAKALKAPAWAAMLAAGKSQTSALARVTYSPAVSTVETVPDVQAAVAADPSLAAHLDAAQERWEAHQAKFTKEVPVEGRPRLTVTAVKQREETD